jgi:hypothetical protein
LRIDHDDRNGWGRRPGGSDVLVGGCDDQFELESDDVLGEPLERSGASVTPTQLLDDNVLALPSAPRPAPWPRPPPRQSGAQRAAAPGPRAEQHRALP